MRIIITCILVIMSLGNARSQVPFTCDGQLFLTLEPTPGNQILVNVVIDQLTGLATFQPINRNLGFILNGIGYRRTDNLLYGIQPVSLVGSDIYSLYQIDALGVVRDLSSLRLAANYGYFGGDVTPDGRFLILVGVPTPQALGVTELVFVDLEDINFATTRIPMTDDFRIFDLAFDPLTGDLFGFDSRSRSLLLIDPLNGNIITQFGMTQDISQVIGMFFDVFGNLFAYAGETEEANDVLYRVDKNTGAFTSFVGGEAAQNGDAASCPFTIDMIKEVSVFETVPCSEVIYTFSVANGTGLIQNGVTFSDRLPNGFSFIEIVDNPFGGNVISTLGSSQIRIENMTLPIGVESITVRVGVGEVAPQLYNNQAILSDLPVEFGNSIVSDNPETAIIDDSTSLLVLGVPQDSLTILDQICENEPSLLDGSLYGNMNTWSTGQTTVSINVSTEGIYTLEAIFGCDTTFVEFVVTSSRIEVSLPDEVFNLHVGDTILLNPSFFINTGNQTNVLWTDLQNSTFFCDTCLSTGAIPTRNTEFIIQVTNEFGCTDFANIQAIVDTSLRVFGPDVFTPNDDGTNDFFYLQSPDQGIILQLSIFNRWGDEVFNAKNIDFNEAGLGWDGTVRGTLVNPAVFVWVAQVQFVDIIGHTFGDVTLLRQRQ